MTGSTTSDRDTDRAIRSWLRKDRHEDVSRIAGVVLDRLDTTPQRRATWWPARRTQAMNKFVTVGLGAAALAVLTVFLGAQLLGPPPGSGESGDDHPSSPEASVDDPTPAGLPQGRFVISGADAPVQITLDISSSGWEARSDVPALSKDDDGLDAPQTVGATLFAWGWPAGTGFNVYGDPCQWSRTLPETPATTPDEIAAAFAAQALTDPTEPVDVAVGGFAGKAVALRVPISYHMPGYTREERFYDCHEFPYFGVVGETVEVHNGRGAGQVDELWILDVNGGIVIIDAMYGPATPADLVEELRTLAESATFEGP